MASKKTFLVFGLHGPDGYKVAAFVPHCQQDRESIPIDAILPLDIRAETSHKARQEWRARQEEIKRARDARL